MTKIQLFISTIALFSIVACSSNKQLDHKALTGIYTGTLPCADCNGIETKLELLDGFSYQLTLNYLGKSDEEFVSNGLYTVHGKERNIALMVDGTVDKSWQFHFEKESLEKLDLEGNPIDTEMKDLYILNKTSENKAISNLVILNGKWNLEEVKGIKVSELQLRKQPTLALDCEQMKISGNDGCNQFFGNIKTLTATDLVIPPLGSTKMACPNDDGEIVNSLSSVQNYKVESNRLILMDAENTELLIYSKLTE